MVKVRPAVTKNPIGVSEETAAELGAGRCVRRNVSHTEKQEQTEVERKETTCRDD